MAFEFSKELKDKVKEIHTQKELQAKREANIKAYNEKVVRELEVAEETLKTAVEVLANEPNAKNAAVEKEARKKVAELRLEVSGASERSNSIFYTESEKANTLILEVLQMARKEIDANKDAKEDSVLERIAAAKKEYLEAAKAYHDFLKIDGNKKYRDLVREVGASDRVAKEFDPRYSIHRPIYTNRDSGPNKYGFIDHEIYSAWDRGEIE
ncbi:hypothetical protein HOO54_17780 [Bacillus sp. WMMC1349]|uniref:hypothetical protein n=1 Tax=Bacillus sp. WMMC1349 TaxID=2736254 RepID=UPI00155348C5|nr:hypothetical protein [Bacillus sp. WMMC1349]NPC94017.1 hypothetical protein [Bacillus sp. WMMC1349]